MCAERLDPWVPPPTPFGEFAVALKGGSKPTKGQPLASVPTAGARAPLAGTMASHDGRVDSAAAPAVADPVSDPEEGLSWMTRLMMMLMMLPTAAPADPAAQGDWKERLERFNAAAASDESEDEVRLRGLPGPHAPSCVSADLAVPGRAGRPTMPRLPRLQWIPAARARHCLPRRGQTHMKLISPSSGVLFSSV